MPIPKISAAVQGLTGVLSLVLLIFAYTRYSPRIGAALRQLDSMAGNTEGQIDASLGVLQDFNGVLADLGTSAGSHERTIDAILESVKTASATAGLWEKEVGRFSEISSDAASVCDRFEKGLPIRVPEVTIATRHVDFQLPEIVPRTQTITLHYPASAAVKSERKQLRVPTGITVENKDYKVKVVGVDIGFSYPAAIRTDYTDLAIDYAKTLEIKNQDLKLAVPTTPEVKMKDHGFEVPDNVQIGYRELMKAEKDLLQKTSVSLKSTSNALLGTQKTLAGIRALLNEQAAQSLVSTRGNMETAGQSLSRLSKERLPGVVQRLKEQRAQINSSREMFSVIEGLLPLAAVSAGLIPVGMIVSAVGKFVSAK